MARPPPKRRARSPPPSSSAAPPPSESEPVDDAFATYRTKNTVVKEMGFDPYKPLTREEMKVVDNLSDISEDEDKVFKKEPVNAGKRFVPVDPDKLFDAKRSPKCSTLPSPLPFENNPSMFRRLTKCATLAIQDYNSQTHKNYRFVDIVMATWRCVAGNIFYITFRARNAEKNYTFQATVFTHKEMRKVWSIRMKGTSTWYPGTLSELD